MVTDVVEDPVWSLNLRHEIGNPWDRSIASRASVPDLLRRCLGETEYESPDDQ